MLAIFHEAFAHPPEELNSPASHSGSRRPKLPQETLQDFLSHHPHNTYSVNFGHAAALAYVRPETPLSHHQRYLIFQSHCHVCDPLLNVNDFVGCFVGLTICIACSWGA